MANRNSKKKNVPGRNGHPTICDGVLSLAVSHGPCDGEIIELDIMSTKLATEAVERKHKTYEKEWVATAAFLEDLAGAIREIGVPHCSPTMAYQIWHAVVTAYTDLKKNMLQPPTLPSGTD